MSAARTAAHTLPGLGLIALAALLVGGCPKQPAQETVTPPAQPGAGKQKEAATMEPGVTIRYFGHACFLVTDDAAHSVALDPFDAKVGYKVPELAATVCLVSHGHFDHSNVAAVSGDPQVVKTAGTTEAEGLTFVGVAAPHHEPGKNAERGDVVMFRWTRAGIKLAHLGDLGDSLSPDQISALGPVDVLMVPVGGFFTIDANKAVQAAQDLKAKFVIPMHYKTAATKPDLPIAPVEDLLKVIPGDWVLTKSDVNSVTITKAEVDKPDAPTRLIVLNYE
ncbi:MAG: MBL fold metallo-hydrolase [Armatimonadetes bacterium]|nr:MBL fold metallo-hydrolase [Armatimonadota bacterium]